MHGQGPVEGGVDDPVVPSRPTWGHLDRQTIETLPSNPSQVTVEIGNPLAIRGDDNAVNSAMDDDSMLGVIYGNASAPDHPSRLFDQACMLNEIFSLFEDSTAGFENLVFDFEGAAGETG